MTEQRLPQLMGESFDAVKSISIRELGTKIFIRFKLFLACLLLVPLLAVWLTSLVPGTYEAKSKVQIKYESPESNFFGNLTPERKQLSGQGTAEIVRSLPVCTSLVQNLKLNSADIPRPAFQVLLGHVGKVFSFIFRVEEIDADSGPEGLWEARKNLLAEELKQAVTVNVLKPSRMEIIVRDETLEIVVRSPTREKVAPMADGLAECFITEYYRLAEADAQRAYDYLAAQTKKVEARLVAMEAGGSTRSDPGVKSTPTSAHLSSISTDVSRLEMELRNLELIRTQDSPEMQRKRKELDAARILLAREEALEMQKTLLNRLRDQQYQTYLTLQLYRDRLLPISILERAVTPPQSRLVTYARYVINGLIGLGVGAALGLALVLFLSAIDQRLYTSWDIESAAGLKIVGNIPVLPKGATELKDLAALPANEARGCLRQVLGEFDPPDTRGAYVLLVTGASTGEGKTFVAAQLAAALAKDQRTRVLLVDANLSKPKLTEQLQYADKPGLVEILSRINQAEEVVLPTTVENLKFVPAGQAESRARLGFFRKVLVGALTSWRKDYEVIVLDCTGAMLGNEAALLARESDGVLIVARTAVTRQKPLQAAVALLRAQGSKPMGIIINCREYYLPRWLYRSL